MFFIDYYYFFVFLFNHTIIVDVIIAYDILCMWCI